MTRPVPHRQEWLRLPPEKRELVEILERFARRCEELHARVKAGQSLEESDTRDIVEWYGELNQVIRRHLPPEPELVSASDGERAFAAGAMLLMHYEETVLSDLPIVDTLESGLTDFRVDFANTLAGRRRVRQALEEAFNLGPEGLAELQLAMRPELDALNLRHTIVVGLDQLHPLRVNDPGLSHAVYELFGRLYRDQVFRCGEVDLIRTGTSLFFTVPFPRTPEFDAALKARRPAERESLRAYMNRFGEVRQIDYANFPVFGFFRGEEADPTLLASLEDVTGLRREKIAAVLGTMVSILPRHEVDKYIVHDAWGHQWQAALLAFEDAYREVATYERLPDLDHEVTDRDGERVGFRDALTENVRSLSLGAGPKTELWDRFLEAELSRRLVVSKNGLVAELLADVVEYKYLNLHPEHRKRLISSSFFKEMPAKIDLALSDVSYFVGLALKGFERLVTEPEVRAGLVARYGETPESELQCVRSAVDELARRTAEWLQWQFAPTPRYETTADGIDTNRCGWILFNLLGLGAVLNESILALQREPTPADLPVSGFVDLLVLSVAAFYNRDRERNVWRLDEYVHFHFERCYRRFMAALAESTPESGGDRPSP